jgi:hypothetical protein
MQWNKQTWMSIGIAVIMIASVIGLAIEGTNPANPPVQYGGYKFTLTSQGYRATIKNTNLFFYQPPNNLEDIPFDEGAKTALDGARVVWFSYDPNDLYAPEIADTLYYMEQALSKVTSVYVQRGLVNASGYPLPEITCANATTSIPVIIIQSGNETAIAHRNGCITATASTRDSAYSLGDRLLYQETGVMH